MYITFRDDRYRVRAFVCFFFGIPLALLWAWKDI